MTLPAAPPPAAPRRAFHFDAASCSGCKACQVACKDRNGLPEGVLWRRVYEVAGGGWERRDGAWLNDVVAYNLSIGCNHCERPVCVEVCPAGALTRRPDGIVLLDPARCMGCRYCEWACPYGAPQYDARAGRMGKCDFCVDELERGRPPACVAACPLRSLDTGPSPELEARHGPVASAGDGDGAMNDPLSAHPMPPSRLTAPSLLLTPHPRAAVGMRSSRLEVANAEEVRPGRDAALREPSLVAFTLLAQTAVGLVWAALLAWAAAGFEPAALRPPLAAAGPLALAATAASLLHLGSPGNAWRVLGNLRASWLSREVLLTLVFMAIWVVLAAAGEVGRGDERGPGEGARVVLGAVAAAGVGLVLVLAMARVYRVRTIAAWDTGRTTADFLLTAATLGAIAGAAILVLARPGALPALAALATVSAIGSLGLLLLERDDAARPPLRATAALASAALAVSATPALSGLAGVAGVRVVAAAAALLAASAAAIRGRTAFYARYRPTL